MDSQVCIRLGRLRWLAAVCGLTLVLSMSPPVAVARAAQAAVPGVVPGADPVDRPLPASAVPDEALPDDRRAPVVPPGTAADGPGRVLDARQWAQVPKPGRARAADGSDPAVFTGLMLRSGFALGDTSLVAYFDLAPEAPAWSSWRVRLYEAASGTEQASTTLSREDLAAAACTAQREYCRSFGAADGWALDPSVEYFVTVAAELDAGGESVSDASDLATPRTTVVPPPVTDQLAAGCGCGNAFDLTGALQATRAIGVNTGTGAFVQVESDLAMVSFGVPFAPSRTYSSANAGSGPFGPGWAWSYGMRVVESDAGALVLAEDGAAALFTPADGGYRRPAGVRSTLRRDGDGWVLQTVEQISYRFDAQGRLASVTNARGAGVRLAYTDDEVRLTDASGRVAVARLDGGLIQEIRLPDHRRVRFFYADGRLAGYRDARGFVWSYRYGPSGQMTEVVTPQRVVLLRNEYGASGRVARQHDALDAVTQFGWDAGRQEASTTDPDGVVVHDGYRGNVLVYTQRGNRESDNHRYDASLNRNLVVNGKQLQHEATYDAAGNPTSQTAPRPMNFGTATRYDAHNNPIEHTDANGNVWRDTYNDFNELIRSEDAEHHVVTYDHDDRGLLVATTDQRGKVTHFENLPAGDTNAGLPAAVVTPEGRRTEYRYDRTGRQVAVVDPRGTVPGADRRDYTTWTTYDAVDQVTEVQEPGKRQPWRTYYDAVGQTSRTVTPTGVWTRYTYYPTGRLKSVFDARRQTAYTYTAAGRRASERVVLRHAPDLVTTYAYNGKGLVAQVTSPRGNVKGADPADFTTTYVYDGDDNLVRTSHPYPGGQVVSRDVGVDELDRTTSTVDELGQTATSTRDNTGNVTATTDTLGRRATMGYDANGRQTSIHDTGGNVTRTEYDAAGNKIRETSPTGGVTTWAYDGDGLLVAVTEPRGNVPGADPERFTTHYAYDQAGHRVKTVDPLGHETASTFDAGSRLVAVTDANGHTVRYTYREDDLLSTVHAPDARYDPRHPESGSTIYRYDEIGQLASVTDPNGHSSRAVYDDAGRVIESIDALGRRTQFGYDADGNRTSTITLAAHERVRGDERARRTIADTFDIAGRRDRRVVGSGGPVYTWGYDAKDRITSYGDPAGVRAVSYDGEDQIQRVVRTEAGGAVERFAYGYDALGNVTSRSYPDGTTITAGYDASSRITELTATGGSAGATPATWRFGYDVADNRTSTTLPQATGLVEQRGYDDAGRLTSIGTTRPAGQAPTGVHDPVSSFQLELDPVGNPTRVVTTRGGVSESVAYAYDQVDRLLSACYGATTCDRKPTPAGRIDYTYDLVGNRTSQHRSGSAGDDWTRYSYDAADELTRQVARDGRRTTVTDYRYDLNGNQIRAGRDRLEYNLDNTLARATIDGSTTTFGYDATGLRLTATTGAGAQATTQRWAWDTNGSLPEIAAEQVTTAAGATVRRQAYAYGPDDEPLALLQASTGAHAYTHDWLGGVAGMLSPAGVPVASYDYDPFGNPRTGPTLPGAGGDGEQAGAPANPLQFTGAYQDSSTGTGNYYLRARNYSPSTGRFTSVDPAPQSGSAVSAYAYADNNPTSFTDPTGMQAKPDEQAPSPEDVARAHQLQNKSMLDVILEAGGQILMEFLGITDLINCLKGNIGSCVTLVIGSLPWGKIFKAKKIAEAIYRAGKAVVTFLKELDWARAIIRGAERAAEAAKAAAALAARRAAEKAAAVKAAAEEAARKAAERAAARARAAAARAKAATKAAAKKAEDAAADVAECRNSFVAGTLVLLASGGAQPIEQVQAGETVLAGDPGAPGAGQAEPHQVTAAIRTDDDTQFVDLTIADGAERHTITTTDHHPFWSVTQGRWVDAGELRPGELLRTAAGTFVQVGAVRRYQGQRTTYNLTVDDLHTYYVVAGGAAVLVHNCTTLDDVARNLGERAKGDPTRGQVVTIGENGVTTVGRPLRSGTSSVTEGINDFLMRSPDIENPRVGGHAAATHVETAVAWFMRRRGVQSADLVINHTGGPCTGPFSCTNAVRAILPRGSSLTVWFPGLEGGMSSVVLRGRAAL